jgi:hypothetical protein
MTYADTEVIRLRRARAHLRDKLRLERRELRTARNRHIAMSIRVERDEGKLAAIEAEMVDLGAKP